MARPAGGGKRRQSDSPSHLRAGRRARSCNKNRTPRRAIDRFRPARQSRHARSARRRRDRGLLRRLCGRPRHVQRGHGGARAKAAHRPAARGLRRPADEPPTRRSISSSGAWRGAACLEYRIGGAGNGEDLVVIEPQAADYWPQTPALDNADTLALSRFAYHAAARRRAGAGIAALRCVVQDLRSGRCELHRHAGDPAASQGAAPAGRLSGDRAACAHGRLPHRLQARCRRR